MVAVMSGNGTIEHDEGLWDVAAVMSGHTREKAVFGGVVCVGD